jgi:thioredoxin-related protein
MQKVTRFFPALIMLFVLAAFIVPEKEKVRWLSIAEMQAVYNKNPKPILVDVYTSWCGWCKVMDKQTYSNDQVAAYINEKYYAVKFDAESKDSVEWRGKKFGYNAQNKVNDMAIYLLNGQLSYPTTVFLSSLDAKPAPLPGYLKPKEIESPLKFFGDGAYKTKNFPEYLKGFSASW